MASTADLCDLSHGLYRTPRIGDHHSHRRYFHLLSSSLGIRSLGCRLRGELTVHKPSAEGVETETRGIPNLYLPRHGSDIEGCLLRL